MKKSKFSEEQIVNILKEVELGAKVAETCRKHGLPKQQITNGKPNTRVWRSRSCGT